MQTVFVGYDAREHEAAAVCVHSMRAKASRPLRIYLLEHQMLRSLGLFAREWRTDETGQTYDVSDGKPFSTAFSHSRFLAFHLAHVLRCDEACMFVDCDFLFLRDPVELLALQKHQGTRIGVVQRDRRVNETQPKMDGMVQQNYRRKLWSALFTFTPALELAETFTPHDVNTAPGAALHSFFGFPSDWFWRIDPRWHHIPSLDTGNEGVPFAVHYSEFSPWLNPDKQKAFGYTFTQWHEARADWIRDTAKFERPLIAADDLRAALEKAQSPR